MGAKRSHNGIIPIMPIMGNCGASSGPNVYLPKEVPILFVL